MNQTVVCLHAITNSLDISEGKKSTHNGHWEIWVKDIIVLTFVVWLLLGRFQYENSSAQNKYHNLSAWNCH